MIDIILIFVAGAVMEIVDSSLGMMYGTLLAPVLIFLGYDHLMVIPAILISQATGGITGALSHHKHKNADFNGLTHHMKLVLATVISGVTAVTLGVLFASYISDTTIKIYIGLIVILMGVLCLFRFNYSFKWWKIYLISFVASFNKSATGGGFGPLVSTGKIVSNVGSKVSIATTTLAEVPLCLFGFFLYTILNGFPEKMFTVTLMIGAAIGGFVGPYVCSRMNGVKLKMAAGLLAIISGVILLLKIVLE